MRVADPRMWVALLSAAAVGYVVFADFGRTAPGELATAHGRDERLAGNRSCAQCHGGWFETMSEACMVCHEQIAQQVEAKGGLHGKLADDRALQCALCHSEHHGAEFAMVNQQTFALAGVPDRMQFDHRRVGFDMQGKHLEVACNLCHLHSEVQVLPEGARRYGGLSADCASCHEDVHRGAMGADCRKCHGQDVWDRLSSAEHDRHLALVGGHADVACRTCHPQDDAHSLERLGTGAPHPERRCADCHASPHTQPFAAAAARAARRGAEAACVVCHEPEHLSFRDERLQLTAEQHAASGFALAAPHAEVACAKCHAPELATFAARYPGRDQDRCSACHADPHGGQFAGGPFGLGDCIACHDRRHWGPVPFGVAEHARTAFALTGSHADTECRACHREPIADEPRAFRGTEARCGACHGDAHDGFFADALARNAPASSDCDACHLTTEFAALPEAGFAHEPWTGFALRGAHAQEACEACHPRSAQPDAHGRTFGRVAEHFGAFRGCATCHVDAHRGAFDGPQHPREVNGATGCARCHVETSFRSFPKPFDHLRWTSFALLGAHAATDCSSCHPPLRAPDEVGRTWSHARGQECADCHQDPHAGQFAAAGKTDCQRCHRSAVAFADVSFRHDIQSRFRLGEAHEKLACSACHKPETVQGVEVVRYRPMGAECRDCHGATDDPLRRRKVGR